MLRAARENFAHLGLAVSSDLSEDSGRYDSIYAENPNGPCLFWRANSMTNELIESIDTPVAFVVDDDDVDREVIAKMLRNQGVRVRTHATADSFLRSLAPEQTGCIVLDICMPDISGQDLQEQLNQRQIQLPVVFVSG
jgi:PleD family two-component response regulator